MGTVARTKFRPAFIYKLVLVISFALPPFLCFTSQAAVVTSGADTGPGTLRQVVQTLADNDVITFNPTGLGIALNPLNQPVTVTKKNITIIGPAVVSGGSTAGPLIVLQGTDIRMLGITFNSIDPGSDRALDLTGSRAVIQKCVFSLNNVTNAIHVGAADSIVIGEI